MKGISLKVLMIILVLSTLLDQIQSPLTLTGLMKKLLMDVHLISTLPKLDKLKDNMMTISSLPFLLMVQLICLLAIKITTVKVIQLLLH